MSNVSKNPEFVSVGAIVRAPLFLCHNFRLAGRPSTDSPIPEFLSVIPTFRQQSRIRIDLDDEIIHA
jgi:hypothetical protein